jgi:DNA-directed RNA polymerase specialized sigma24 family protein
MKVIGAPDNLNPTTSTLSDTELLTLFHRDPQRAWELFIARYADVLFSYLNDLGFNYDQAMDRFVYICEKLSEQDFRRLKMIRYAGSRGDLTPWLRKVAKHLCINWAWSAEGRRRLFKPVARLSERDQHVFQLYFWKGMSPSEIHERLRHDQAEIDLIEVLDCLERIFAVLSHKNLWRLMSNLARRRDAISIDEVDEDTGARLELADARPNPEEMLIQKEAEERMDRALESLSPREQLIIRFRYEEGTAIKEIAEMLHLGEREVKGSLKAGLVRLRRALK